MGGSLTSCTLRPSMWRLRAADGRTWRVTRLPATLGSGTDCDVVIPHASVLPRHARLGAGAAGGLHVEAAGEGIIGVGRRAVRSVDLAEGEELVVGRLALTVERDAAPRDHAPEDEGLTLRDRAPQLRRREARGGLLRADLAQLSG